VPRARFRWWIFLIVLLSPALLTCLSVLFVSRKGDTPAAIAVLGGGAAGIACGAMLGRRFGKTAGTKIALGIIFAAILGVACIGMSCFGCLASGYQLNF
jgi:hypothetical protein